MQCLRSLLDQLDGATARIIVVDNCSQDGSVATLQNWIATHDDKKIIRLIESATNAGFAGGNNFGIRAITADYYLLLNNDTLVRPGAIDILLQTADSHRNSGIVSPRLEWPDGTPQISCFRYLSPISEFIDAAQTGPVTALLRKFDVPLPVSDTTVNPPWTSFACALVRDKVLDAIGLLDDGFFMYFEDVNYCRRARKAGWDIVHDPKARVIHLRGGSSPVKQRALERKQLPRYYYASRTRYFYLSYGWLGLTLANVLWSLGRCLSGSREMLERRGPGLPEKQWSDIWTNWLNPGTPWFQQQEK